MIQRFPYLARVIVSCRYLVELHRVNQARGPPVSAAAPGYYLLKNAWQTTALRNAILAVVVLLPVWSAPACDRIVALSDFYGARSAGQSRLGCNALGNAVVDRQSIENMSLVTDDPRVHN